MTLGVIGQVNSVFLCRVRRVEKLNLSEEMFVYAKCESGTLVSATRGLNDRSKETCTLGGA